MGAIYDFDLSYVLNENTLYTCLFFVSLICFILSAALFFLAIAERLSRFFNEAAAPVHRILAIYSHSPLRREWVVLASIWPRVHPRPE